MVVGYDRATARFHDARMGTDPAEAFIPLFESLNWAASIDERLGYPDRPELRGLRFARNRVHHQYADALWLDRRGAALPIALDPGSPFFEWRWKQTLPEGRHRRDGDAYAAYLAGHPARFTLDSVWAYLTARSFDPELEARIEARQARRQARRSYGVRRRAV
jgi:hypothetical protein